MVEAAGVKEYHTPLALASAPQDVSAKSGVDNTVVPRF